MTVGWPRHFATPVMELQRVVAELHDPLAEALEFLRVHWGLPPSLFGALDWALDGHLLSQAQRARVRTVWLVAGRRGLLSADVWRVVLAFAIAGAPLQWHNRHGLGCLPAATRRYLGGALALCWSPAHRHSRGGGMARPGHDRGFFVNKCRPVVRSVRTDQG